MDEDANVLGYDCDGYKIYEFAILRAIWANDIDIEELKDADPRHYCAIMGEDGKAYAISVYDWWYKDLIRKRENINGNDEIPVIVKPIIEMENYELAHDCFGEEIYYDLDRNELKTKINSIIKKNKPKKLKLEKM